MTITASIICGVLFCWLIVALWKNCHRDFEQEEQDERDAYYDKILKK
jgi:hypothetical protein